MSNNSFINDTLKATGQTIEPGTYPGVLYAFSEPKMFPVGEKFRKPGKPTETLRFELRFAVKTKTGIVGIGLLCGLPDGGKTNKMTKLYKTLKTLKGSDPTVFTKEGEYAANVSLKAFVGATANVQVANNEKDFPKIEAVSAPMEGVVYPSLADAADIEVIGADEEIPF